MGSAKGGFRPAISAGIISSFAIQTSIGGSMENLTTSSAGGRQGDSAALGQLFSELYRDLRQLAHARLKRHGTVTLLDTTALVHESYLRFLKAGRVQFADRAHFIGYAARVMRSVVVDFARESLAQCRGGREAHIALETEAAAPPAKGESEILQVHEALEELATVSERMVRVVEMRYFGGMSDAEIGEALSLTERTVRRDWEKARIILAAALKG
jgi:RNA polymerase sigma factor (TIGR02999 family)